MLATKAPFTLGSLLSLMPRIATLPKGNSNTFTSCYSFSSVYSITYQGLLRFYMRWLFYAAQALTKTEQMTRKNTKGTRNEKSNFQSQNRKTQVRFRSVLHLPEHWKNSFHRKEAKSQRTSPSVTLTFPKIRSALYMI